jgi:hypothetical protein
MILQRPTEHIGEAREIKRRVANMALSLNVGFGAKSDPFILDTSVEKYTSSRIN